MLQSLSPVLALYDPFGVDVPLNCDTTTTSIMTDHYMDFNSDHFDVAEKVNRLYGFHTRDFTSIMDMDPINMFNAVVSKNRCAHVICYVMLLGRVCTLGCVPHNLSIAFRYRNVLFRVYSELALLSHC